MRSLFRIFTAFTVFATCSASNLRRLADTEVSTEAAASSTYCGQFSARECRHHMTWCVVSGSTCAANPNAVGTPPSAPQQQPQQPQQPPQQQQPQQPQQPSNNNNNPSSNPPSNSGSGNSGSCASGTPCSGRTNACCWSDGKCAWVQDKCQNRPCEWDGTCGATKPSSTSSSASGRVKRRPPSGSRA